MRTDSTDKGLLPFNIFLSFPPGICLQGHDETKTKEVTPGKEEQEPSQTLTPSLQALFTKRAHRSNPI
jgi:hypothetical protein